MILCIETSSNFCSVALSQNGELVSSYMYTEENAHAANLTPSIDKVMKSSGLSYRDLEAVAVSSGPGSYTGLRIGVSTAKGIAYGAGIKLIAVPTLSIIARAIFEARPEARVACAMQDARRNEVYASIISRDGQIIRPTEAVVLDENSFADELRNYEIAFGGQGAFKCEGLIKSPNMEIVGGIAPQAKYMARLAQDRLEAGQCENVAYFEPFYLKDFIATTPKNKVLGF